MTTLDYASPSTSRIPRRWVGAVAVVVAACSTTFIIWRSVEARLELNSYAGADCHTGYTEIGTRLLVTPIFWLLPIGCLVAARKAAFGMVMCRASVWAAIVAWLLCMFVGY